MSWIMGFGLVGAFLYGIWLGFPRGYYDRSLPLEEIDRRLSEPGERQKVKRHITFLNLIARKNQKGSDARRERSRSRSPFQMR